LRVLVVTNLYLSGNGNWVAEQVRSLRSEGVEVDVLFFDTRRTRLYYATKLAAISRAIGGVRYDVIHTHHTYTMLMVELVRMLSRRRVPVVLTSHEPEILDRQGRTRTWHPTSRLRHSLGLKRFAAKRADFVVFVARQLAQELGFEGRYAVIPCGVDLEKFRPLDRSLCRQRIGVPGNAMVVFFPADPRNMRKRFSLAREAFLALQERIGDAMIITGGGISADEMPHYYNAADVVLQTSFCEASPTVVKEALACEVPVVSTDAGDARDVMEGIPNCAVCGEDSNELAVRLLAARGRRATRARDRLLAMGLSLDEVARRIVEVYKQVGVSYTG